MIGAQNFALYETAATGLLTEIESNYVGYFIAIGDPAGYASQRANENIVNTCWARFIQCIGLIKKSSDGHVDEDPNGIMAAHY